MFHCFNWPLDVSEINRFSPPLRHPPVTIGVVFLNPARWGERDWCCIFVKIDCSAGELQLTWKSAPPREPDCVGSQNTNNRSEPTLSSSSHPVTDQAGDSTDLPFSNSDVCEVLSEEAKLLLTIETVREIDWVFNLEIWIIYILMTILSRWNLLSGLIWFPTKPKIVTTDSEFMN